MAPAGLASGKVWLLISKPRLAAANRTNEVEIRGALGLELLTLKVVR